MRYAIVKEGVPQAASRKAVEEHLKQLTTKVHPFGTVQKWTEDFRNTLGIYSIRDVKPPLSPYQTYSSPSLVFDGSEVTQVYTATDLEASKKFDLRQAMITEAKLQVVSTLDNIADFLTGLVPLAERESWYKKEIVARKYMADPNSLSSEELTLLQNELNITGALDTDLPSLAAKIIQMADLFTAVAGKIAGFRRVAMADLDALPDDVTQDQVNTVRDNAITQAETAFVAMTGKPSGLV